VRCIESTEAKFISFSEATQNIVWLRRVLEECNTMQAGSTACQFAKRKHVGIRYHFLGAKIQEGSVKISKVNTKEMQSDFLAKVLQPRQFIAAISKYHIMNMIQNHGVEEEC